MAELLRAATSLSAGYGEAVVLDRRRLSLGEGQSLALLGRNGTGKTTLINTHRRRDAPARRARSRSAGATSRGCAPTSARAAGIGWVPQERNIFKSLTVEENLTAVARPGPWTVDARLRDVPAAGGAAAQSRQPALGRRAADAGDRPRADAQPELAAARRAARRAGADHRRGTAGARCGRIIREEGLSAIVVEQNAQKILGITDRGDHARPRRDRACDGSSAALATTARLSRRISASPGEAAGRAANPDRFANAQEDDAMTDEPSPRSAPTWSAACCAPQPLKDARAKHRAGEITRRRAEGGRGRARSARIIAQAGGDRAAGRHRRRVPPRLLALRFPRAPRRRAARHGRLAA